MSIPRNDIVNLLTTHDKAAVLMAAGLQAGRAADLANRGPADFWAALAQQGKERDEQTWRNYPTCWHLIRGKVPSTLSEPLSLIVPAATCENVEFRDIRNLLPF
jgi:hypothetical protein